MKCSKLWGVVLLTTVATTVIPRRVLAEDLEFGSRQFGRLLLLSGYGAAAGMGAGLILWPVSGRINTVFLGTGVGFIMGSIAGVYHVTHGDDPQNPFTNIGVVAPVPGGREGSPVALTYEWRF